MIEEQVIVTSLDVGGVWVEGVQQSACGSCSAKAGCGKHTMSQLGRKVSLWLSKDDSSGNDLTIGQQVIVGLPEGAILRSTLVLYGIPLMFLLAGAIVGHTLAGELASILLSIFSMLLGFKLARNRAENNKRHWQPKFLRSCETPIATFEPIKVINP
ncbi:MAG: SoxR reducing system RseC family protein [Oleispira sp.]|nr:SoxR reducing system RseC family protein [Oleispira sp.]